MGKRTGKPRGRPTGSKSKGSKAMDEAVQTMAARLSAAVPGLFQGDSHELLMSVYKNPELPLLTRIDAAKAAIGYERPKLASMDMKADVALTTQEDRMKALMKGAGMNGHSNGRDHDAPL